MLQDLKFLLLLILFLFTCPFLGNYMARVFQEQSHIGNLFGGLERGIYRFLRIDVQQQMDWRIYLKTLLTFNLFGFLFLLALQLLQGFLPLNPEGFTSVPFFLAFNTAASFTTNTNWQAYAGETTLSYLTQMLGLTAQNFLSAATGLCALLVLIRGIVGRSANLGNFYADFTRSILYILLPLSILLSMFLVFEGVIDNFSPYVEVTTLEGMKQVIPMGPVASQEAIKQLGTNGGGFFSVNSAHPFENPTFLTNLLENLAILLIPASCVFMYGKMVRRKKEAYVLFSVMCILWIGGLVLADSFQMIPSPLLSVEPILEGQELRFGPFRSVLWSISTTATANGSTNSMISSLSPMTGGIALLNMMLGEVIFGGVGVGLAGMLMFALLTVFIAGLMVGRTPEYLGKKIEKKEMQWVMLAILAPSALILIGSGIATVVPSVLAALGNQGPHGFTEILYAFTSASANNGSAFAGLNANIPFFNIGLGFIMILARLAILVPCIAIGGLLGPKKVIPYSSGTFRTDTRLFAILLTCIILIFAGLTFFPALTLGPILEQFALMQGRTF